MAKKKISLQIEPEPDAILVGICSQLRDYRLTWFLNKELGINFIKKENFHFKKSKNDEQKPFSFFYFNDKLNHREYCVVSNQHNNSYLIPGYKAFQYILFIYGYIHPRQKESLIKKIKKIKNVLTVTELDKQKIKNSDLIISELEIHIGALNKKQKEKEEKKKKGKQNTGEKNE